MLKEVVLATSSVDNTAYIVDPRSGAQLSTLKGNLSGTHGTALVGPDYVVSAQTKGTSLQFWAWGGESAKLKCHGPEKVGPVVVTADGGFCAAGGVSGRLYVWEVGTGQFVRAWDAHYKAVSALAFSPDGGFLFSGGEDAMVSAWNMLEVVAEQGLGSAGGMTGRGGDGAADALDSRWTSSDHTLPVSALHVSRTGTRLFSVSLDRTARIWDSCSGQMLAAVGAGVFLRSVTVTPDETFLFLGGGDGLILRLDIDANARAAATSEVEGSAAGWSGGGGGNSRVTKSSLQQMVGHTNVVTSLAVAAEGQLIVSGSADCSIRVWHSVSRQCVRKIDVVKGAVSQVMVLNVSTAKLYSHQKMTKAAEQAVLPLAPFKKFVRQAGTPKDTSVVLYPSQAPDSRSGWQKLKKRRRTHDTVQELGQQQQQQQEEEGRGGGITDFITEEEVASLLDEVTRLTGENARWQKLNNTLCKKLKDGGGAS